MNVNKAIIVGRVTADPQLRTIPSGQSVATFSVATNRTWTGKTGNKEEEVEFHNIVVWARQAEVASQFLTKGQLVFVEGRIRTRAWQDKQGQTRRTTEIVCERFQLGPRPMGQASGAPFSPRPAQTGVNVAANSMGSTGSSQAGSGQAPAMSTSSPADMPPQEEIPVINLEDDVKPEDLPF